MATIFMSYYITMFKELAFNDHVKDTTKDL